MTIFINDRECQAQKGETILQVARNNGIYIPTMCYLTKVSPIASCRMCVVEAQGVDGFVLSCQAKATDGLMVVTDSEALLQERTKIMQLYAVNHPLECGVCDKSGECDLQNKTADFCVSEQLFAAKDQRREIKNWGLIQYDPSLCILCEKCVHVCNEIIGDDAIHIKAGGYRSTIVPKGSETLDCTYCGECIAVCPVGALVSTGFKYRANAWEMQKTPSSCAHCSAGCHLIYETRHESTANGEQTMVRVTNEFEFASLCGAGRFGFDFANRAKKDEKKFLSAVLAFKNAKTVKFDSRITNEEALMLQRLKSKLGFALVNESARALKEFLKAFGSSCGSVYSATLADVENADGIVVLGGRISSDNPAVRYAVTQASRRNGAKVAYLHPMEDALLLPVVTQFVKYEPSSEEAVMAALALGALDAQKLDDAARRFFDDLDMGYLSAEASFDEEEQSALFCSLSRAKNRVLILGSDLLTHPKAANIARLAGLLQKHSDFKVLIVPEQTNDLGVALICDLDEKAEGFSVGYNREDADFIITSLGSNGRSNALDIPALNQQEGTITTLDKQVVPLNAALPFDGYELNDIANAFGVGKKLTVDFTRELPTSKGFRAVNFDDLPCHFENNGEAKRGYALENITLGTHAQPLQPIESVEEYNGTIVYLCDPVLQFSPWTAKCGALPSEELEILSGSKAFAAAAKISDGMSVAIDLGSKKVIKLFKIDAKLKGTVALLPDVSRSGGSYRFIQAKITQIGQ